jgi:hypothetical protein
MINMVNNEPCAFSAPMRRAKIMPLTSPAKVSEEVLAELTSAAYHVVLRHGGVRSPFIDVQLDLWRELRRVLHDGPAAHRPHAVPVRP